MFVFKKITLNDENKEQETFNADNEVEQNVASPLIIQDIQNEDSNNDIGMGDADEIQGDDEKKIHLFWKVVQLVLKNKTLNKMECYSLKTN
jgi:hypothetical protein